MNKFIILFALLAVFGAASAQIIYSSPLIGGYAAAPLHYSAPLAAPLTTAPLTTAPLTTAWTSHYAAAPLAYAWKK